MRKLCRLDHDHLVHTQNIIPYHPLSSIRQILLAGSGGPDQTVRMHRLIWAFAVRLCPKTRFHLARTKCKRAVNNMRTSKARISMRIRAVGPGPCPVVAIRYLRERERVRERERERPKTELQHYETAKKKKKKKKKKGTVIHYECETFLGCKICM